MGVGIASVASAGRATGGQSCPRCAERVRDGKGCAGRPRAGFGYFGQDEGGRGLARLGWGVESILGTVKGGLGCSVWWG